MNCQDRAFIIYSQIVGIAHHPRAVESAMKTGAPIVSLKNAALATADAMIEFRNTFGKCGDPNCKTCA